MPISSRLTTFLTCCSLAAAAGAQTPSDARALAAAAEDFPLVRQVDPFIGTDAHGHTYPGATLPFGMVQLSPDTGVAGWDWCSGYHYSDRSIMGFSHTHLSGTGAADYGDFLFVPTTGTPHYEPGPKEDPDAGYRSRFSHAEEAAMPGYYEVRLSDYGIDARLTATERVGVHSYTYPRTKNANVIVDLTHAIGGGRVTESHLEVVGDRELRGHVRKSGWSPDRFLYFVARFSKPFRAHGLVVDGEPADATATFAEGTDLKCHVRFDTSSDRNVLVKVALSAVSCEGAAKNMAAECPDWDFERVRERAMATWEKQLSKVSIAGGTPAQRRTFYTALYRSCLAPNLFIDVDGRYRGMDQRIHTADGFTNYTVFSLWDTFRATHPLFTLIERERTNDFISSLLGKYEQCGLLPFWELASGETWCMIGYHSIPVIVDAWVKGIRGFDVEQAYAAMKHSAMQDHQGLADYKALGYIPIEGESNSVSRTVEYAYDDWCIAVMAKGLGRDEDHEEFTRRSQSYRNLYDASVGFMRGRDAGGAWNPEFDPDVISPLGAGEFTEGNAWHYTWFVPHDVPGLIDLMGGDREFVGRLDELFSRPGREHADVSGLIGQYAHGNEPCHNYAYLYAYAGAAWKTQEKVAQIVRTLYSDQPDGSCGNEDCGQMSAWFVFSALGFYPVCPGLPIYVLGTPRFPRASIQLENGNRFEVVANGVSDQNIYVRSAMLDGEPYRKGYIAHEDIVRGGELVLEMGPRPEKQWARSDADRPYSVPGPPVVAAPRLVEPLQAFVGTASVELECDDAAATIVYTTDGSEPDRSSTPYTKPLVLDATATVKARAYRAGHLASHVMTAELRKTKLLPAREVRRLAKGLNYAYFEGGFGQTADFANTEPVREGHCTSFDHSVAGRDDEFGLRFTGYFKAPKDGIYRFWTESDDGSRLLIDSELIVDNDGLHGARAASGFVGLAAGFHEIEVLYFENQVDDVLRVSVTPPGGKRAPIDPGALYRTK